MKTLLIGDFSALNNAEVEALNNQIAGAELTIISLTQTDAVSGIGNEGQSVAIISESEFAKALADADKTIILANNSPKTLEFCQEHFEALKAADAQAVDFGVEEAKQNEDIAELKRKLRDLSGQVSSLVQELASVKMVNQAILGCMPEDQRQQIEATAAHMQATMDSTMSLMRQFVEYSAKLTDKISIEKAMSEFGETIGLGETFADMVLGTLENVYSGESFSDYVNNPIAPYDLATDPSLQKAMMASYSSIVSSINRQA